MAEREGFALNNYNCFLSIGYVKQRRAVTHLITHYNICNGIILAYSRDAYHPFQRTYSAICKKWHRLCNVPGTIPIPVRQLHSDSILSRFVTERDLESKSTALATRMSNFDGET